MPEPSQGRAFAATEAESLYRQLVEASPDAIVVHGDGRVLYANSAAARRIGGAAPADLVGRPIAEFMAPDLARLAGERVREMLRTGAPGPVIRGRLRRFDGSLLTGEIASKPVVFEGRPAIQVVIRDVSDVVAAEQELRRREQEFKALVEDASDVIARLNRAGEITYINPAVERYTGVAPSEMLGRGYARAGFTGEVLARWEQALKHVFRTAQSTSISFAMQSPEGERVFECRFTPQQGPDGTVESVLAVGRDISELMQAQRAVARSEATLRSIVEGAAIGITQLTGDGTYVDVNPAFAEMLGYTREELRGRSFRDLTHPDDVNLTADMQRRVASGERPRAQLGKRFLRKDGSVVWARVTGSRVHVQGSGDFVVTMVEDVTAQLEAQEALRASEARFRSLIEHSADLIAILDSEGRAIFQSASIERVLGYRAEEMLGRDMFDMVHPDDVQALHEVFRTVLATPGMVATAEYRMRDAWGKWRPLQSTARNQLEDPAVRGVVVNTHDLTSARELETQLLQSRKMEAVGRLAGGIAHDFNNILTAIQGHASLLADELPETSPHRSDVEQIQRSSRRAASLTRQLLAFSRRQVLQPRVVDLNGMVAETEKMVRRLIGEDVELRTHLGAGLPRIKADPAQIEQILLNLCVNARDAMPDGGRIEISTDTVAFDDDFVRQFPYPVHPGRYVLLSIADTGTGIEPAVLDHIFEPFFTTKEPGRGTGLGLSSVYGTVKQSGGYIWVDTVVGEGTTFRIYLPAVDEAAEQPEKARAATPAGSGTILLVEDEPAVRALARRVLERSGYTVLEAGDGLEALELCEERCGGIDLVLTDVVMPRLGGGELAARLAESCPGARVLFMSGYTQDALTPRSLAGGVGFLDKPLSPELLRAAVAEALRAERTPSA